MARVFTITPGLENMGALKTGGQGSVYKGRRIGEITTAVKILPTPIYTESTSDKNYVAFTGEVAKLQKVNEVANPNIVKFISSGITDTGNFPFIEVEYVEGYDLAELLQPPHHSIFTLSETLKVAEQLANAIAHCHNTNVKHGDLKSSNVKFNIETGNYVLLDFGLAVMSDEQRRTSIRQMGNIEFMAPEQNTGQMLFQTDVYSFGVIIFQLLTGAVPFPLKGQGESARNDVRLAHMVLPVPDIIQLRQVALPFVWNSQKKEQEMQLPQWLLALVDKCLEKKPERRFRDGQDLHNHLIQHRVFKSQDASQILPVNALEQAKKDVLKRHEDVKIQLNEYRQQLLKREDELTTLKRLLEEKQSAEYIPLQRRTKNRVSVMSFVALLFVTSALAAFVMFPRFKHILSTYASAAGIGPRVNADTVGQFQSTQSNSDLNEDEEAASPIQQPPETDIPMIEKPAEQKNDLQDSLQKEKEPAKELERPEEIRSAEKQMELRTKKTEISDDENRSGAAKDNNSTRDNKSMENEPTAKQENDEAKTTAAPVVSKKYLVVANAYFYNEPDENTRRDESISPFEHAVVQPLNERYGFVYVVITDPQGQVFKGWLRKKDLRLYSVD